MNNAIGSKWASSGMPPSTVPSESERIKLTRRQFFKRSGLCLGSFALGSLLHQSTMGSDLVGRREQPLSDHPPTAKSIIYLHMVGAPSQLDLFEYKPALQKHDGELCPKDHIEGKRFAFIRGHPKLLGTRFTFDRYGQSGHQFSELLPNLSRVSDELAIIKTLHTDEFNHGPSQMFLHTGFSRLGRPSLGSWISYGLGSATQDLPAYVVMITGTVAGAGSSLWSSGFLPSVHQGIQFRSSGDPVLFLSNPPGQSLEERRRLLDTVQQLNRSQLADVGDPEIATRIDQYELAYRMQTAVPELMDIQQESQSTIDMYGAEPGKTSFANNCLLARRLVERGVRIVQLYDQGWDHHGSLFTALPKKTKQVDQPIAALIQDLKLRGLLDSTLVVFGSEFGRTPMLQGTGGGGEMLKAGRDHHKEAYTVWMAGGGVRGGISYGKTDELGYHIVDKPVHVHDLNATILHLLGLDHERLTFKYQGRQFRLTDIHGVVQRALLT